MIDIWAGAKMRKTGVDPIRRGRSRAMLSLSGWLVSGAAALALAVPAVAQDARRGSPGGPPDDPILPYAALAPVPHGEIRITWYSSKVFKAQRRLRVYTPPGYANGRRRYPVLYLMHGGGGDDATWNDSGRAGFILDNLIAAGKAQPMIVVMPNSGPQDPSADRYMGNTTPAGLAARRKFADQVRDDVIADLTSDIVPQVDRSYRTLVGRANRAVAGYSFGGAETIWAATREMNSFAWFGVFSMGIQGGSAAPSNAIAGSGVAETPAEFMKANPAFFADPGRTNRAARLIWIGVGKDDGIVANGPGQLADTLRSAGIRNDYHLTAGGHAFQNWRDYLRDFYQRIFR
jgi:enterochelin esterase family protein